MATVFPSIQRPSSRKRTYYKPQIRTEFESGYVQSRAKGTKGRWQFELTWDNMIISDFEILQTHFDDSCGDTFTVLKEMILTDTDLVCRYSDDQLTATTSSPGFYSVTVALEEE